MLSRKAMSTRASAGRRSHGASGLWSRFFTCAPPREFETRLEGVHEQARQRIEPGQLLSCRDAFVAAVPHHAPYDLAVILLAMRLIVLAIRPAPHQLNFLGRAVVADRLDHENGLVTGIEAEHRERQPSADLAENVDQQCLLTHQQRRQFHPARRDIRDHLRLHERPARHQTGMRHQISSTNLGG
jgi:hypothetical protein